MRALVELTRLPDRRAGRRAAARRPAGRDRRRDRRDRIDALRGRRRPPRPVASAGLDLAVMRAAASTARCRHAADRRPAARRARHLPAAPRRRGLGHRRRPARRVGARRVSLDRRLRDPRGRPARRDRVRRSSASRSTSSSSTSGRSTRSAASSTSRSPTAGCGPGRRPASTATGSCSRIAGRASSSSRSTGSSSTPTRPRAGCTATDLIGRHVDELVGDGERPGRRVDGAGVAQLHRHRPPARRLDVPRGGRRPLDRDRRRAADARRSSATSPSAAGSRPSSSRPRRWRRSACSSPGVAHELNNPLASIVAFSQLLRTDPCLPDGPADPGGPARPGGRTGRGSIVDNLLDFARQRPPERVADATPGPRRERRSGSSRTC